MSVKKIKKIEVNDKAGNSYGLVEVDGVTFPDYFTEDPVQRLKDVREMPGRDDDVIIAAYPKAGTHWVWEITNMLLRGSSDYHPAMKEEQMLELSGPAGMEKASSPRVLNSHLRFRQLPAEMVSRSCKIIHVIRNPKDMAVSRYCHVSATGAIKYAGTFSDYLPLYMDGLVAFGSWFDYTQDWETTISDNKGYPIHVIMYENIKRNPVNEVRKLSEFLGVDSDPALIEAICDQCSFNKLRTSYEKGKNYSGDKAVDPNQYSFRKGTVGDWKNWFTVAESEMFDSKLADKLKDYNRSFIYE